MNWWLERPTTRRPVEGGLKTRRQHGEIGTTWWSQRFVQALERLADPVRLRRGRSYARAGQVVDMEVQPGRVSARVQGSQVEPYEVTIDLPAIAEEVWLKIEERLADHAGYAASLLAGEIPHEIEQVFVEARRPLFPRRGDQLVSDCTCSDWQVPCKHVAAAYYILAEQLDDDPFVLLLWRGRERDKLLDHLAALRQASTEELPVVPREPGLRDSLAQFWTGAPLELGTTDEPPWHREAGPLRFGGEDKRSVFIGLIEESAENATRRDTTV